VDEILGCSRRERCLPQPNTWLSTFHLPTNSSRRTGWQCGSLQPGSSLAHCSRRAERRARPYRWLIEHSNGVGCCFQR
jgi:hypothetical protein